MLKIMKIFIFVIFLFPLACNANENIKSSTSEKSPEQVVENFYHNYLIAINTSDTEMGDNAINIYVTQRLINEVNESDIDWDYYIDAQDICDFWMGNIKVEQVEMLNNKAKMKLALGNESCKSTYKIKLLKSSSGWKIDNVVLLKRFNKLVK
ncbi:YbjP/YqhG family protein [Moellerella wisconsensis]|uniref:YbjP/YqhG family protein n=1 Tax=Moellerella wisconsensis TaxID=158849 RepID=A0ACD3Y9X7_9GAMM|nr:DUF3828 domain-containing protein [Moellerella wisconsensis]UNH39810.1 YbjP/YqhG family protein [Moellerella wisconsensis]UNH43419.1 YbjP/YqhG family protein [Moellerella wisconsensis]